jgi:hypothetical protein
VVDEERKVVTAVFTRGSALEAEMQIMYGTIICPRLYNFLSRQAAKRDFHDYLSSRLCAKRSIKLWHHSVLLNDEKLQAGISYDDQI